MSDRLPFGFTPGGESGGSGGSGEGIFGTGAHGFRYHFEGPFDETADNRVEVRFATTGKLPLAATR